MRFWLEPRESPDQQPELRGYVRDLRTGEERLVKSPEELGELIRRQLLSEAAVGEPEVRRRQSG